VAFAKIHAWFSARTVVVSHWPWRKFFFPSRFALALRDFSPNSSLPINFIELAANIGDHFVGDVGSWLVTIGFNSQVKSVIIFAIMVLMTVDLSPLSASRLTEF